MINFLPEPAKHPIHRKLGRAPWGNRSTWKPHQNVRERERRLLQVERGFLKDHPTREFITFKARRAGTALRMKLAGLVAP